MTKTSLHQGVVRCTRGPRLVALVWVNEVGSDSARALAARGLLDRLQLGAAR